MEYGVESKYDLKGVQADHTGIFLQAAEGHPVEEVLGALEATAAYRTLQKLVRDKFPRRALVIGWNFANPATVVLLGAAIVGPDGVVHNSQREEEEIQPYAEAVWTEANRLLEGQAPN